MIYQFDLELIPQQEIVGLIIYDHERERIIFRATKKAGAETLVSLLKMEIPVDFGFSK